MTATRLQPDFRDAVSDAYISLNRSPTWTAPDEWTRVLFDNLERAFAQPGYFTALREHLRSLKATPAESAVLSDDERERVLTSGLAGFDATRLAKLATDLVALLDLRDAVVEEMSDYWWGRIKQFAAESGPLPTAEEMLAAAQEQAFPKKAAPSRPPLLVGAFNGADADAEFTLKSPSLILELFGELTLTASSVCTAALRDAAGTLVAEATAADRRIVFPLPSDADPRGWTVEGTLTNPGEPARSFKLVVRL